jgi:hypothetical protein
MTEDEHARSQREQEILNRWRDSADQLDDT